ncbi:hypothetical protein [Streptomyces sp. NBC_01022]|uniref:hypothetical protein n=1 Tax=Streptomyces sp. NBC_01022 TaxID=2903723 RepID=UPI002DDC1842|nr:hypothetical protein [Streptomyces sp. NBC_01022]WRZ85072.1 hypothetical protein OG316_34825 [Streptomyces sp. NBC_01022]
MELPPRRTTRPAGPDPAAAARPGASAPQARAVWSVITEMYAAYTRQDRAAIDTCLDPDATIRDSAAAPLLCGRTDLDRIRDERPPTGEGPHERGLEA